MDVEGKDAPMVQWIQNSGFVIPKTIASSLAKCCVYPFVHMPLLMTTKGFFAYILSMVKILCIR